MLRCCRGLGGGGERRWIPRLPQGPAWGPGQERVAGNSGGSAPSANTASPSRSVQEPVPARDGAKAFRQTAMAHAQAPKKQWGSETDRSVVFFEKLLYILKTIIHELFIANSSCSVLS